MKKKITYCFECQNCGSLVETKNYKSPMKCQCKNPNYKKMGSKYTNDKNAISLEKEAIAILKDPNLFKKITEEELDKKIVGEVETRKVIFLCAAGGRLVEDAQIASFNLLVNDSAGAGKDYITGGVLNILPKDIYVHKTRISPTVLTYWHNSTQEPDWTWNGKVFYPEDISHSVLNSEVFKVMCSSGSSATVTIKQKPVDIEINGKPVMITTTATAIPNPELVRRFAILNLDSSKDQTKAIMRRQSEYKMKGIVPEYNPLYREAMGYLERVKVKILFADLIDQHFPENNIIMRTNYFRFLDFICASAAFHQFQRKRDGEGFVVAEAKDYNIARDCFLKLFSNKYMIPLTLNQKDILKVFKKNLNLKGSVSKLHPLMSFISDNALKTNFQILVRYGILDSLTEKDCYNRDIEVYRLSPSYQPNETLKIPLFKDLVKTTPVSSISFLCSLSSIP
jgi:hypothetical protein